MENISNVNLYGLDLNLLVGFEALMQERSVTRAARRVGITQSAMSNMLRRIRDLLDDEVLVRVGHTMVPTMRATQLEGPIRRALEEIRSALAPPLAFDPVASTDVFWIGLRGYMEGTLLPHLTAHLLRCAPRIRVRVRRIEGLDPIPQLQRGRFGLAAGYFPSLHEHLRSEVLFHDPYVVLVREGHSLLDGEGLTLDRYVEASHLLIAPMGGEVGMMDSVLAGLGRSRHVALGVSTFLSAPTIVASTDLICTLPLAIADAFAGPLGLRVLPVPAEIPPTEVSMCWHERVHSDPGHRWLRDQLREQVQDHLVRLPPT